MAAKKGLGRGLNSLLFENALDEESEDSKTGVLEVDINKISPNKNQPRSLFDENSLTELADSIKNIGILQPLTVKKLDGDYYEIIAGERRWRAARLAKLITVPVIIKEYSSQQALEAALIENVQREDLNPLEEALTYNKLAEEFNLTQDEIATKVGKSRSTVTNAIRLLKLDPRVQAFVKECKISNGHARALLAIENGDTQFELAEEIIENDLNVRQTEDLVKVANTPVEEKPATQNAIKNPEQIRAYLNLAKDLKAILGTKVNIKNGKNKGKIEIEYYSDDELDRIVGLLKKTQSEG
jgi:ParB family chromosome partitioning protein